MRCDEFETRLQEALDERLDPAADSALAAHSAECAACRSWQRSLRAALQGLAALPRPAPGDALTARVLAALADQSSAEDAASQPATTTAEPEISAQPALGTIVELPPRRTGLDGTGLWSAGLWSWAAVAAVLLLAAYPMWRLLAPVAPQLPPLAQGTPPGGQAVPPDVAPQNTPSSVAALPLPSLAELAEESKGSARQLARDTQRSLNDALALASLWESPSPTTDASAGDGDWLRGMAGGVAPLADSTLSTFNVFRGLVPTDKETKL